MEDATNKNTLATLKKPLRMSWETLKIWWFFIYLFKYLTEMMFVKFTYSGANKYLIHCRFFKFSHLQRMERSVIFIVGTPQLWETET